MRNIGFWLTSFFVGAIIIIASNSVSAQEAGDSAEPTRAVTISKIQHNCSNLMSNLRQIHTSDALLRVNSGQSYNSIATRLMARLNSRLSINRLDGAVLIDTTSKFEKLRTSFVSQYNDYDNSMSELLRIDCQKSPEEFYNRLQVTRKLRSELATTSNKLSDNVIIYRQGVVDLSARLRGGSNE